MKLGKLFLFHSKLFLFLRKSIFRIFDIQVLWRHHMPKHKTRNTFHWITWEVNSLLMKFGQFMWYYKRKKNQKIPRKLRPGNYLQDLLCLQRIKYIFYWKMKFLEQATCIRYVLAKLSKFIQISTQTSLYSFLKRILWKLKRV